MRTILKSSSSNFKSIEKPNDNSQRLMYEKQIFVHHNNINKILEENGRSLESLHAHPKLRSDYQLCLLNQ